jgi:hypothetical protein
MNGTYCTSLVAGTAQYALTGPTLDTEVIRSVKVNCTVGELKKITRERFTQLGEDPASTGEPRYIILDGDSQFSLWPVPDSSSYKLTAYVRYKHPYMSAGSQYFSFTDDKVGVIREGVIADIFEDKDDNRYSKYEASYEKGIRIRKRNQHRGLNEANLRLLPGGQVE